MRNINSFLIIVITVVTLFVMLSLKPREMPVLNIGEDKEIQTIIDDTGYIFDDFNMGVNLEIPKEQQR